MTDLPDAERLQVVHLQPGDVLVASLPETVTNDELQAVTRGLMAWVDENAPGVKVLVVTSTIELAAYRPVAEADR